MKKLKKLSIIIPHFNNWNYLEILLNSIPLNQYIEVIVVDDHSKDSSDYIDYFQNFHPDVIFLQNESGMKGAGSARNTGLKYATGDWILFADSDDVFLKENFVKIYSLLHSNYDLIYFTPTSFIQNTNKSSNRHKPYLRYIYDFLKERSMKNELRLRYKFSPPWSKLIRKEVLDKNNIFFEKIMYSNDVLFSAKVGYYAKSVHAINSTIYAVRQSSKSLTSYINESIFDIRFDAWLNYVIFLKEHLPKREYDLLNVSVIPMLKIIKDNKLNKMKYLEVIKKSKKNNINLMDKRLLNPIFVLKLIKKR